jgi:hypothetical protein
MTQNEFGQLLSSVATLSTEQMRQLRNELDRKLGETDGNASEALQQRLVEAGVLSEVKPPISDLAPYRNRRAVPIQGEPLSETIIRERR